MKLIFVGYFVYYLIWILDLILVSFFYGTSIYHKVTMIIFYLSYLVIAVASLNLMNHKLGEDMPFKKFIKSTIKKFKKNPTNIYIHEYEDKDE